MGRRKLYQQGGVIVDDPYGRKKLKSALVDREVSRDAMSKFRRGMKKFEKKEARANILDKGLDMAIGYGGSFLSGGALTPGQIQAMADPFTDLATDKMRMGSEDMQQYTTARTRKDVSRLMEGIEGSRKDDSFDKWIGAGDEATGGYFSSFFDEESSVGPDVLSYMKTFGGFEEGGRVPEGYKKLLEGIAKKQSMPYKTVGYTGNSRIRQQQEEFEPRTNPLDIGTNPGQRQTITRQDSDRILELLRGKIEKEMQEGGRVPEGWHAPLAAGDERDRVLELARQIQGGDEKAPESQVVEDPTKKYGEYDPRGGYVLGDKTGAPGLDMLLMAGKGARTAGLGVRDLLKSMGDKRKERRGEKGEAGEKPKLLDRFKGLLESVESGADKFREQAGIAQPLSDDAIRALQRTKELEQEAYKPDIDDELAAYAQDVDDELLEQAAYKPDIDDELAEKERIAKSAKAQEDQYNEALKNLLAENKGLSTEELAKIEAEGPWIIQDEQLRADAESDEGVPAPSQEEMPGEPVEDIKKSKKQVRQEKKDLKRLQKSEKKVSGILDKIDLDKDYALPEGTKFKPSNLVAMLEKKGLKVNKKNIKKLLDEFQQRFKASEKLQTTSRLDKIKEQQSKLLDILGPIDYGSGETFEDYGSGEGIDLPSGPLGLTEGVGEVGNTKILDILKSTGNTSIPSEVLESLIGRQPEKVGKSVLEDYEGGASFDDWYRNERRR